MCRDKRRNKLHISVTSHHIHLARHLRNEYGPPSRGCDAQHPAAAITLKWLHPPPPATKDRASEPSRAEHCLWALFVASTDPFESHAMLEMKNGGAIHGCTPDSLADDGLMTAGCPVRSNGLAWNTHG